MMASGRPLARGSRAPHDGRDWLAAAVRPHYPKLALALGADLFEALMGVYIARGPNESRASRERGGELVEFLAGGSDYPAWYGELAKLDRAYAEVWQAPPVARLSRNELSTDRPLQLVPASTLLQLTTTVDEAWSALGRGEPPTQPRTLDWPRTVLVWRDERPTVYAYAAGLTEGAALRTVKRGTSLTELSGYFTGDDAFSRALDMVLRWADAGVLAR